MGRLESVVISTSAARRPRFADGLLDDADVGRLEALRAAADVELHDLPLLEGAETFGLDGALVTEDVFAAVLLDESKALRIVEPLHCSSSHVPVSFLRDRALPNIELRADKLAFDERARRSLSPGAAQLLECLGFDLPNALARHGQLLAHSFQPI